MRISIAGKQVSRSILSDHIGRTALRGRVAERGLTLIELMVGMAIIGMLVALVVGGASRLFDADLKEKSSQLASTIRFLYNKAATERVYLRLVLDIDDNSYHVEASSEPFQVTRMTEEDLAERKRRLEALARGEKPPEDETPPPNPFSPAESYLLKKVSLGDNVLIKDVQTDYTDAKVEEGEIYVYFFPNGYATPAIINLMDADDETNYSLEVLPLSGRVRIENEYRDFYAETH